MIRVPGSQKRCRKSERKEKTNIAVARVSTVGRRGRSREKMTSNVDVLDLQGVLRCRKNQHVLPEGELPIAVLEEPAGVMQRVLRADLA